MCLHLLYIRFLSVVLSVILSQFVCELSLVLGEVIMAPIVIEDLDPIILEKLKLRAQQQGRTLVDELKLILEAATLEVKIPAEDRRQVQPSPKSLEELGWSPGFFERTAGAWQGEPLTRGQQGEYEQRLWELL